MAEMTMRPTIFLYTDAAQIDARTKKAMVAAGFLPVKVATLDAVKFLEPTIRVEGDLSAVQRAALHAIATATFDSVKCNFGEGIARLLLSEADADA